MDGLLLSRALARNQVAEVGMVPEAVDGSVVLDLPGRSGQPWVPEVRTGYAALANSGLSG